MKLFSFLDHVYPNAISDHHNVSGWNMVCFVFGALAVAYLFSHLRKGASRGEFLSHHRVALGAAIMIFGIANIRVGMWIPWRSFLAYDDFVNSEWYKSYSSIWTESGVIMFVAGLFIMAYPELKERFGWHGYWLYALAVMASYLLGVWSTDVIHELV